jgi:hypothetical protein
MSGSPGQNRRGVRFRATSCDPMNSLKPRQRSLLPNPVLAPRFMLNGIAYVSYK